MRSFKMVPVAMAFVIASSPYAITARQSAPAELSAGDQIRVHAVSIAPGGRVDLGAHADALLIPLGTDLDGRVPADPVTWREAGITTLENRGATSFEGLFVELVAPRSNTAASFPPEAMAPSVGTSAFSYRVEGRRVRTVLDNPRVFVTAHRLPDWQPATEPWHWHTRDLVLVYLAGGDIMGSSGQIDARHVRRGDFDVLPANLPHVFQNVGNSPIEFLLITLK